MESGSSPAVTASKNARTIRLLSFISTFPEHPGNRFLALQRYANFSLHSYANGMKQIA
jgi:hypothetical protein